MWKSRLSGGVVSHVVPGHGRMVGRGRASPEGMIGDVSASVPLTPEDAYSAKMSPMTRAALTVGVVAWR
ncbi:MAG: hypothetical protein ACI8Y4_004005 [Candidatus Poriferisodalaceae bacterium]|jgi:hypothetical protein